MSDTLCRNCNAELQVESECSECNKPIQQICKKCHYATMQQIHDDCTYGLEIVYDGKNPRTLSKVGETHVFS